jgi:NADPH:quinone reductase-like Zn-dependent oxidoreductase
MKAVVINGYNTVPSVEEIPMPCPGTGEVLVRVKATGLNPLDVKLHHGYMVQFFPLQFPYTLGTDFAGTIEEIGAGVQGWEIGDEIIGRTDPTAGGAIAEYVVVSAEYLSRAPSSIALEEAAGIPTAAGTAWQALFENANLIRGQSVLIHAGAGGVGSFAIQFARDAGAKVSATASGDGVEIARQLGADKVIDYRSADFTKSVFDIDLVLDTIGSDTQRQSYGVLRVGGSLLTTAMPPDDAMAKAHQVKAGFVFHSSDGKRLRRVVEAIDARQFKILIDRKVLLDRFAEAFAHQASGRSRGKIIVGIDV